MLKCGEYAALDLIKGYGKDDCGTELQLGNSQQEMVSGQGRYCMTIYLLLHLTNRAGGASQTHVRSYVWSRANAHRQNSGEERAKSDKASSGGEGVYKSSSRNLYANLKSAFRRFILVMSVSLGDGETYV